MGGDTLAQLWKRVLVYELLESAAHVRDPARRRDRLGLVAADSLPRSQAEDPRRVALLLYLRQVDYDRGGDPGPCSHEYHLGDALEFGVVRRGPGRRFR